MATNLICGHCGAGLGGAHHFDCPIYTQQRNSDDMGMPPPVGREASKPEAVNHPAHYGGKDNPYEAIKIIEALKLDFCIGNALKYMLRAGKKAGQSEKQDLEKAVWYLQRRISQLDQN